MNELEYATPTCANPTGDCFENDPASQAYCPARDTCELYDIHKDHEWLENMFWSFVVVHQGAEFLEKS